MRVTQEKTQQYVGIKYGKDIAEDLQQSDRGVTATTIL
jgi:hypothetical protein